MALAAVVLAAPGASAQTAPQGVTELSAGAAVAWSHRDFYAVELGAGRRSGQARLALAAAGGRLSDGWGGRVEARGQFVLLPFARIGLGWYGGMGAAWMGGAGQRGAVYLTAVTGVERAPGRPRGWFVEAGVGGGVRVSAGMRWRAFPNWWPQ